MFTSCLRLELEPLGVKVVDLKTGTVKTKFMANANAEVLPPNSYYNPAREVIEKFIVGDWLDEEGSDRHVWARQIVRDVSKKTPSFQLWRGTSARLVWFASFLPPFLFDAEAKKRTGLDVMEKRVKEQGGFVKPQAA
jgi:1-acylglycerone phosphate reductase